MLTGHPCSYLDPTTLTQKRPRTLPYLSEIIGQRSIWSVPRPRKEPCTTRTIVSLCDILQSLLKTVDATNLFLSIRYAVYDWIRLGLFTGSRISEYGQSKLAKGQRFAVIPNSKDAGIWAGQPLAFIAEDFTFYDGENVRVDQIICLTDAADIIQEFHIRFRFDKSKTNFSIRRFRRLPPGSPADPVVAGINIIRRAHFLGVPANEPLGQCRTPKGKRICLKDDHMRNVLREACVRAYPNPNHYFRLHISGLVAHSTRVTAAVCLKMGGATDEEIAFRLRWHISSVPTYLRECFDGISSIMQKAIVGSFRAN